MSKLILGTAQFGSVPYGVKGDGLVSEKELEQIARVALAGGIRIIHTSWQYNLPKICEEIFDQFEKIEKRKDNPSWFEGPNTLGKAVYDPEEIYTTGDDYIVPVNVLDGRFLPKCKLVDNWIYARSVFLQGLLLMDFDNLPNWISLEALNQIHKFNEICQILRLKNYEAALGWVLGLPEIDHVIIGVNNAEQLKQLLDVKPLQWDYDFSITDENVLDPRRWPTLENQLKKFVETSTAIEGVNIKL